ncbi:heparan-alpha-glucosaminide N-acetyltransferase [Parvibium lacunae]|uniref:DUF1624 domain-containing protein n=1 Tax=Parvibium lacunae TaxID=1888893 RepID=A0A368L717_9BURK|nr:heparan-alpha-glucosaminide N-acetyltransferase [Parvibium lacunae]RCS59443.1 DUF1624 domain-containing protein [Parvibium lacunae]
MNQHRVQPPTTTSTRQTERLRSIDGLRGMAIIAMIFYHACYDLHYFSWIFLDQRGSPLWQGFRNLIVSCFLLVVGISIVLRSRTTQARRDWWLRWFQIAGAAILVSLGSALLFPKSFIYFGVLHFVALTLLLSLIARQRWHQQPSIWLVLVGLACWFSPYFYQHEYFNPPYLNWIGFTTRLPHTEDYVPLFPWLGMVLLGMAWANCPRLFAPLQAVRWPALFCWLGQRSLLVYLLHQPLLMGILGLLDGLR